MKTIFSPDCSENPLAFYDKRLKRKQVPGLKILILVRLLLFRSSQLLAMTI
jgi:hypothetical protein